MSRRAAWLLFAVVVAAQVIGLVAFAVVREAKLRSGVAVILQTVPVDPRSLLQGDYAILDYEIATLPDYMAGLPAGSVVYVRLAESDGGVWQAVDYRAGRPRPERGGTYIRGKVDARGRLDFGIGTYFVPEGTGRSIENAADVKVAASLDGDGRAVIRGVIVDGAEFPPGRPD